MKGYHSIHSIPRLHGNLTRANGAGWDDVIVVCSAAMSLVWSMETTEDLGALTTCSGEELELIATLHLAWGTFNVVNRHFVFDMFC